MRSELPYETLKPLQGLIAIAFVAIGGWYLVWRAGTLNPDAPVFSGLLYAVEIYGFVVALMHLFMTWRLAVREPPAAPKDAMVDVFVPSYNEPVDMVRKTLLAARAMELPHVTWLLDDGNRAEMRALAERLGVRYLARERNDHAKAGNLNNALAHSRGEFVVIFDADHAPQKNFLVRTLGYFNDPKVAFVQTPQDFFNLDSYQHRRVGRSLWTEQSLFFKVIQRGKDLFNAAFFCGSCAVVRRSALVGVGGFATETVTEDLHTSIRLHKAGWSSVYHPESLAYGIAPAHVAPFLKQRVRWGQGAMQVLKIENPLWTPGLTWAQRLNYVASITTYFDGWQKGLFYIAPVIVLLAGVMPIQVGATDFLLHFIPYYLLSFVLFEELGRGYGGTLYIEQYNFARFAAFAWATLALFVKKLKFGVTDKGSGGKRRVSRLFWPQVAVLALNAVAIPVGLILSFGLPGVPAETLAAHALPVDALLFNIVWALVNGGLGLMTLVFTRRTESFLRAEYRFPVPLPVELDLAAHGVGTLDNVSSGGFRLYAGLSQPLSHGDSFSGRLVLPSGPVPFRAEVVAEIGGEAGGRHYVKALGCRFLWDESAAQEVEAHDRLDLFLYGTDLQWRLLELVEDTHTPLRWLLYRTGRRQTPDEAPGHWAACRIGRADGGAAYGIAALTPAGAPTRLLAFADVGAGGELALDTVTRTGIARWSAMVNDASRLENAAGPVCLLHLGAVAARVEVRQPASPPAVLPDRVQRMTPSNDDTHPQSGGGRSGG